MPQMEKAVLVFKAGNKPKVSKEMQTLLSSAMEHRTKEQEIQIKFLLLKTLTNSFVSSFSRYSTFTCTYVFL